VHKASTFISGKNMNDRTNPHAWSINETQHRFETSSNGLSSHEVHKRRRIYGANVFKEERLSLLEIFVRQLKSPLIFILLAASVISLALQEVTDFFVITGLVIFNALVGFWQEVRAHASLAALKKLTETKNVAIRDGKMKVVPSSDLVPGDFLVFDQGEVVTADVRLTESASLMADESLITGESIPVVKNHEATVQDDALPFEWNNLLISGSTIVRGNGRGIVVRTGKDTYLASIGEKAKEPAPNTPLQSGLKTFTNRYVIVILSLLSVVALIGIYQGRDASDLLYILLASLVSAVPEGLPFVITLSLIRGALILKTQNTLVRDLPSVETLGSATVIATDKTGTITEGKLLVAETHAHDLTKLKRIAVLCNSAQEGVGDPIDVALIQWVENAQDIRSSYKKKWEMPFDSSLMLMATINTKDGKDTLYVKGAYETLREKAALQSKLDDMDEAFHALLKKGYRVLAFGEGTHAVHDPSQWKLHIIGLVGFIDPPKKGVHQAVLTAKRAGLHVIMVTGDHLLTAQAIAHHVGIWSSDSTAISGKEVETLSDSQLSEKLQHATVLARILPEHKYRVVKLFQKQNEVVAVTGDGVNDIPALKAAHIGIAMGDGAEAAKNVSQMVLTDNNFSVIVDAIKNARVIAANIRKAIYYLVSTSIQELIFLSLSIVADMPICLSAIQILWINLVSDGVMDKTFPLAHEEGNVMKSPPRNLKTAFFDPSQIKRICFFGISQGLFCFLLYLYLLPRHQLQTVSTIMFSSIVFAQLANGIQAQKEREPFFRNVRNSLTINPAIFIALPLSIMLQGVSIYIYPSLFSSVPITIDLWVYPLYSFLFAFASVETIKWFGWPSEQNPGHRLKKNAHSS
jgi:Ca2+-transporting ATPase